MTTNRVPWRPVLLLALVLSPLPAQALFGAIPVIDGANLAQNLLQVSKAITQIQHQIQQLETMYANLERIEDPSWRDLHPFVEELDSRVRQGDSLAYTTSGLFGAFRFVMPGFHPVRPGNFEDTYAGWTEIALDTLAATLDSASVQAREYLPTQEQLLELQYLADGAGGNLSAENASNMLLGHIAQETFKLNQVLAAAMNAQNVYFGTLLTIQAGQEATQRWLMEESRRPFHVYTGRGGFTGLPTR